jgi:hypothetical protein
MDMPAKKTAFSKSAFIRSQPATLSAAEVVAKAKAQGMKLSKNYVYRLRTASNAATRKMSSAPKPAASTGSSNVSKADFVRSLANFSPKEIVEKGKAQGVKFDVSYVYNIRGYDKSMAHKKKGAAVPRAARKAPAVPRPLNTPSSAEDLLRAVAVEVGLGRAIELLQGERARVHSILRG